MRYFVSGLVRIGGEAIVKNWQPITVKQTRDALVILAGFVAKEGWRITAKTDHEIRVENPGSDEYMILHRVYEQ